LQKYYANSGCFVLKRQKHSSLTVAQDSITPKAHLLIYFLPYVRAMAAMLSLGSVFVA